MQLKHCCDCRQHKPLEAFHVRSTGLHGRQNVCIECKRQRDRERYRHPVYGRLKKQRSTNWKRANHDRKLSHDKARKRANRRSKPGWARHAAMAVAYRLARVIREYGIHVVVDHWIPLCGRTACGLHVEHNLVLMHAQDNGEKSNQLPNGEPPAVARPRSLAAAVVRA